MSWWKNDTTQHLYCSSLLYNVFVGELGKTYIYIPQIHVVLIRPMSVHVERFKVDFSCQNLLRNIKKWKYHFHAKNYVVNDNYFKYFFCL